MKYTIIPGNLVFLMLLVMGTVGYAGNYDQYIHLVKHRDVHGNLVVPESYKTSQEMNSPEVQQESLAQQTTYREMAPGSHVESEASSSIQQSTDSNKVSEHEAVPETHKGELQDPEMESVSHDIHHDADLDITEDVEEVSLDSDDDAMNPENEPLVQQTMLPAPARSYDFLGANWGMSIPEVKTKETSELSWELDARVLVPGEHRLGYQTQVEGIETFLTYGFEHDRLKTTKYYFETEEECE